MSEDNVGPGNRYSTTNERHDYANPGQFGQSRARRRRSGRVVETAVHDALDRFSDRVTRVEVHLSDQNSRGKRSDDDKRCLIEARLAGLEPLSASHQAASIEQSLRGALEKLEKVVARTIARRDDPKGRTSFAGHPS